VQIVQVLMLHPSIPHLVQNQMQVSVMQRLTLTHLMECTTGLRQKLAGTTPTCVSIILVRNLEWLGDIVQVQVSGMTTMEDNASLDLLSVFNHFLM